MAVTYDKISYSEIELGLRNIINDEFRNVYISNKFKMMGTECIRINLESSTLVLQTASLEERDYSVNIRYYHLGDLKSEIVNKSIKSNIDRLRKHLLDNQTSSTYKWAELQVQEIEYNLQDDENEDNENLHIANFTISIIHHNGYT
tara:strand:+ start:3568 stop:4005 length:438 start_codon:yes stop_codon:yes gene_type:complete